MNRALELLAMCTRKPIRREDADNGWRAVPREIEDELEALMSLFSIKEGEKNNHLLHASNVNGLFAKYGKAQALMDEGVLFIYVPLAHNIIRELCHED